MNSLFVSTSHKKSESEQGDTSSPDEINNDMVGKRLVNPIHRTSSLNDCNNLLHKPMFNTKDTDL